MNSLRLSVLSIGFHLLVICSNAQHQQTSVLKSGWKFAKGDHAQATQVNFDDSGWASVTVPQDWAIEEAGKLAGVDNGNPQSFESFRSTSVKLFYGQAMAIVSSDLTTVSITIEATSGGLKGTKDAVTTQ